MHLVDKETILYEQIFHLGQPTPNLLYFSSMLVRLFCGEPICSRLPEDQQRYKEVVKSRTQEEADAHFRAMINNKDYILIANEHPYTAFMLGDVKQDIIFHPWVRVGQPHLLIDIFTKTYTDGRSALFFTNGELQSIKNPEFYHSHVVHDPKFRKI